MKSNNTRAATSLTGLVALVFLINVTAFAQVQGWGSGDLAALGTGNYDHQPSPQTLANSANITSLTAGQAHTLGIKADGTVVGWGGGQFGKLCDGSETDHDILTPSVIPNLTDVTAVAAGSRNSLFLLGNGTLMVCGNNQFGQLGNGNTGNANDNAVIPQAVPNVTNVKAIAGNSNFFLALKSDGTVWTWGENDKGQLGLGSFSTAVGTPTQVTIGGVASVVAGTYNGMAIKDNGDLFVWGYNYYGQIGNGTRDDVNPPYSVATPTQSSITGVVQAAGGSFTSTAVRTDGSVYTWGYNNWGQFGNGTRNQISSTPVPATITEVVAIRSGYNHSVIRKRDGSVWGWGMNFYGQATGNGTTGPDCSGNCKLSPVQTNAGTGNVLITAGGNRSFAAKPNPATPVGTNVQLRGENVNVLFSNVTVGGITTFSQIAPAAISANYTLPMGGSILNNQPAYEISTTAGINGAHLVCIDGISATTEVEFNTVQILHGEAPNWVNRTVSREFNRRRICARVSSFSPFVIGQGLAPTAASVSVGGRVRTAEGRGITNAVITLTEADGTTHRIVTGRRGIFRFDDVASGQTVVVSIRARRFTFAEPSRVINVTDNVTNIDFVAEL